MQESLHSLSIEQRKNITVSGVESVKSFSETRIELCLTSGNVRLLITGTGLKITGFSKSGGTFTAVGTVESVRYGSGFKTKLFK